MNCVKCNTEAGVETLVKLWTAWDDPREMTYHSWLRCRQCGATYYGTVTDYFFSDDFHMEVYTAEPQAWQESYERARRCPRPQDYECRCPAHTIVRDGSIKLVLYDSVYYTD
jgi:hypothetical protein